MIRALAHTLAFLIAVGTATARLGDTIEQNTARYGTPIKTYRDKTGRQVYIYKTGDYMLLAQYLEGTCQYEIYFKENESELSGKEIVALHKFNVPGELWQRITGPLTTSDGGVYQAWVVEKKLILSGYGPATIDDKKYPYTLSFGTHLYNELRKKVRKP